MKKLTLVLIVVMCAGLAAEQSLADSWNKIGTSGFATRPGLMTDWRRIRTGSVVCDDAGNTYATANNNENGWYEYQNGNTTALFHWMPGGLTIFKPGGAKVDVSISDFSDDQNIRLAGAITKLVKAGDGRIYGLMNWLEIDRDYPRQTHRIFRIDANGQIQHVWSPGPAVQFDTQTAAWVDTGNKIRGMTVGGDGNVYWSMNGASNYWKNHFLWRYNVGNGIVEESPANVVNNGWSETHRAFDLEYVGNDWFAVLSTGTADWRLDAISWTGYRRLAINGLSNPGLGRDWATAIAFDPANKKLWAGGRSTGTVKTYGTSVMTRWNGDRENSGLFTVYEPASDSILGITNCETWHVNGNDPQQSGTGNGGSYWISALVINPASGRAWMSYGSDATYSYSELGRVYTRNLNLDYSSAGLPERGAQVIGLTFSNNQAYALVCNVSTGAYSVYTTSAEDTDTTAPTTPIVIDDGEFTNSRTSLHAGWSATDPESGVAEYFYSIRHSGDDAIVADWRSAGTDTSATCSDLDLVEGDSYYFAVKAKNWAGLESAEGRSDGITIDTTAPILSEVSAISTSCTSAQITWNSSEPANSLVEYGLTTDYGGRVSPVGYVTEHQVTLTGLIPSSLYHYRVRSVDRAGNEAVSDDLQFTTLMDSSTPDTVITGGPANGQTVCEATATFTWTGSDSCSPTSSLTYSYRVDEGSWSTPSSDTTVTLTDLSAGLHTFEVRATDPAGNMDPTPDQRDFTTDIAAPEISAISASPGNTECVITWTTDEDSTSQVEYGLTDSYGATTPIDKQLTKSHSVTITGLASNSTYYYRVRSRDGCERESVSSGSTFSTADTTPPDTQIIQGPVDESYQNSQQASFAWTGTDNRTPTASIVYSYSLDSGSWSSFDSTTVKVISGLSQGRHRFAVKAKDEAGNTDPTPAMRTFTVDLTPPQTPVVYDDGEFTNDGSALYASWFATDSESGISGYSYCIRDASGDIVVVDWQDVGSASSIRHTELSLEHGHTYYFAVTGRNRAGLISQEGRSNGITVDAAAPSITEAIAGLTTCSTGQITWETDEPANSVVEYGLTTQYGLTASSPSYITSHQIGISNLIPSTVYHFRVRSTDRAGNVAVSGDFELVTLPDQSAPDTVVSGGPQGGQLVCGTSATYTWYGTDACSGVTGMMFSHRLDGGDWSAPSEDRTLALSLLGEGVHTFEVKAIDAAGNPDPTPALAAFWVDTTPPAVSNTATSVTAGVATITWQTDEPADSRVEYGLTTDYGNWSLLDTRMLTSHAVMLADLKPGSTYHYRVHSRDACGVDVLPQPDQTFSMGSDTTDPETRIVSGPPEGSTACPGGIQFSFSGTDDFTIPEKIKFKWQLDDGEWQGPIADHLAALPTLTDGAHTFRVSAIDESGNEDDTPAVRNFSVDATDPVISGTRSEQATSSTIMIVWITDSPANSQVQYRELPDGLLQQTPVYSQHALQHNIGISYLMPNTSYEYSVRSVDPCGREAVSEYLTFRTLPDTQEPDTAITSGPRSGGAVKPGPVTFTWTGSDDATPPANIRFQYQIDGGPWTPEPPEVVTTRTISDLGIGHHVFSVRAVDEVGHVDSTPASREFYLDETAPVVTSLTVSDITYVSARINWATDEETRGVVEYALAGGEFNFNWSDPALVESHSLVIGPLGSNSPYRVRVIARDEAGNEAVLEEVSFTSGKLTDLAVSSSDLTFSSLAPSSGDPFTVTAKVRNPGDIEASSTIIFYDFTPQLGNVEISRKQVGALPPKAEVEVTSEPWNIQPEGKHTPWVKLTDFSPGDNIASNNSAGKDLLVGPPPYRISIGASNPKSWSGGQTTFTALVKNTGSRSQLLTDASVSGVTWITRTSSLPGYEIRPGDEVQISFQMNVPVNELGGTSANPVMKPITLTVSGHEDYTADLYVELYEAPLAEINVTVIDGATGLTIQGAILSLDNSDQQWFTDGAGRATILTMVGSRAVYAVAGDHLPNFVNLSAVQGANSVVIQLQPGKALEVREVKVEPLTPEQLRERGINLSDPGNYWVYDFTVYASFAVLPVRNVVLPTNPTPGEIVPFRGYIPSGPGTEWGPSGTGGIEVVCKRYYPTADPTQYVDTVIILPGDMRILKQFWEATVYVRNNCQPGFDITDVVASLQIPSGLAFPELNGELQEITKSLGTIEPQTEKQASWVIRGDAAGRYKVTGVATGNLVLGGTTVPVESSLQSDEFEVVQPRLDALFVLPDCVRAGEEFTLSASVTNRSTIQLYGVSVNLHADRLFNAHLATGETGSKPLGSLNVGETKDLSFRLISEIDGRTNGELSYATADPNIETEVRIIPTESIVVSQSVSPDVALRGDTVQYTITVENRSDVPAMNIDIEDKLPDGLDYVFGSALPTANYSAAARALQWRISNLAAGGKVSLSYQAHISEQADTCKAIENTAEHVTACGSASGSESSLYIAKGDPAQLALQPAYPESPTTFSVVEAGGTARRYYQVLDAISGEGICGVTLSTTAGMSEVSDEHGFLAIPIRTSRDEANTPRNVSVLSVHFGDRNISNRLSGTLPSFSVQVLPRKFMRKSEVSQYLKLFVGIGSGQDSPIEANIGLAAKNGNSISLRQELDSLGVLGPVTLEYTKDTSLGVEANLGLMNTHVKFVDAKISNRYSRAATMHVGASDTDDHLNPTASAYRLGYLAVRDLMDAHPLMYAMFLCLENVDPAKTVIADLFAGSSQEVFGGPGLEVSLSAEVKAGLRIAGDDNDNLTFGLDLIGAQAHQECQWLSRVQFDNLRFARKSGEMKVISDWELSALNPYLKVGETMRGGETVPGSVTWKGLFDYRQSKRTVGTIRFCYNASGIPSLEVTLQTCSAVNGSGNTDERSLIVEGSDNIGRVMAKVREVSPKFYSLANLAQGVISGVTGVILDSYGYATAYEEAIRKSGVPARFEKKTISSIVNQFSLEGKIGKVYVGGLGIGCGELLQSTHLTHRTVVTSSGDSFLVETYDDDPDPLSEDQTIKAKVSSALRALWDAFLQTALDVKEAISDGVNTAVVEVKNAVGGVTAKVTGGLKSGWKLVGTSLDKVFGDGQAQQSTDAPAWASRQLVTAPQTENDSAVAAMSGDLPGTSNITAVGEPFLVQVQTPEGELAPEPFEDPVSLTMTWTDADISSAGFVPSEQAVFQIYWFNEDAQCWEPVGQPVGWSSHTITSSISRSGAYVVACEMSTPLAPHPPDGATDVPIVTQMSWSGTHGVSAFDLFLWKDGATRPSTPTATDLAVSSYQPTRLDYTTRYHWQIIAKGDQGATTGPEWSFATHTASSSDAKRLEDGAQVIIPDVVVTAIFADCFYVEQPDRSGGIRVVWNGEVAPNTRYRLEGILGTTDQSERYIEAISLLPLEQMTLLPVGMTNMALGGGSLADYLGAGVGQQGVTGGFGLNNLGLLVRTWGEFRYIDSSKFFVDDGSGTAVECRVSAGIVLDPNWRFVAVTGISSCFQHGLEVHRLLRVSKSSDIVVLQ